MTLNGRTSVKNQIDRLWCNVRYCPSICLELVMKTVGNIN